MPTWYDKYRETPHWGEVRRVALAWADHRCQVCNYQDQRLDVHHRTYERIGAERPADLTVLCRGCHELFHGRNPLTPVTDPRNPDALPDLVFPPRRVGGWGDE